MANQLEADAKTIYVTEDTLKARKMKRKRDLRRSRN